VVGDLLQIKAGMDIPVDGIVISSSGVLANESAMTGESDELKKEGFEFCATRRREKLAELGDKKGGAHDVTTPVLLSGTQISTGEGWFMALVVGKNSCDGKIKAKLEQNSDEMTPLQMKLEQIGEDLGMLGMYAAILTLHILLLRFFIERFAKRSMNLYGWDPVWTPDKHSLKQYFIEWLRYLLVAVAIIVVAVPEGLPLAVMITLAYSVRRMLIDQNFVKKLASCEIMGGANNICSDKTGTLTMNKMTVTNIFVGVDKAVKVNDAQYSWNDYLTNEIHRQLFIEAVACNTSGTVEHASATEQAMLIFMNKIGVNVQE
jgi:magnesium-transporting ATPase (P-type)